MKYWARTECWASTEYICVIAISALFLCFILYYAGICCLLNYRKELELGFHLYLESRIGMGGDKSYSELHDTIVDMIFGKSVLHKRT